MSGEPGERPSDPKERRWLEIIAEHSDPVTFVPELVADEEDGGVAEWELSKQNSHYRVDKLVENGFLDEKQVAKTKVVWPAGKYDNLEAKLERLEEEASHLRQANDYLETRVDTLEDEKSSLELDKRDLESQVNELQQERKRSSKDDGLLLSHLPVPLQTSSGLSSETRTRWGRRTRRMVRTTLFAAVIEALFATVLALGVVVTPPLTAEYSVELLMTSLLVLFFVSSAIFVACLIGTVVAFAVQLSSGATSLLDRLFVAVGRDAGVAPDRESG